MKKRINPKNVRAVVILAVLVVGSLGYFTMMGIGNLSAFGWDAWSVLCPLGYLESLLASKTFVPRALVSFVVLVAIVVVLGRVFCSWICPMPLWQRWVPGARRRRKKAEEASGERRTAQAGAKRADGMAADARAASGVAAVASAPEASEHGARKAGGTRADGVQAAAGTAGRPNRFKLDSRFGVLLGALASAAIFGFPVFCLVCPVGLTFAFVFLLMRLFAFGDVTWTLIAVPAVLLVEVVFFRKWCHRICPLGALVSLISGANRTFRPTIDDRKCLHASRGVACFECSKSCPEDLDIRRPELSERSLNNCTKCKECAFSCPAQAITFPLLPKKKQGEGEKDAEGAGL